MIKKMDLETLKDLLGRLGETEQVNFSDLSQILHLFEENIDDFTFLEAAERNNLDSSLVDILMNKSEYLSMKEKSSLISTLSYLTFYNN